MMDDDEWSMIVDDRRWWCWIEANVTCDLYYILYYDPYFGCWCKSNGDIIRWHPIQHGNHEWRWWNKIWNKSMNRMWKTVMWWIRRIGGWEINNRIEPIDRGNQLYDIPYPISYITTNIEGEMRNIIIWGHYWREIRMNIWNPEETVDMTDDKSMRCWTSYWRDNRINWQIKSLPSIWILWMTSPMHYSIAMIIIRWMRIIIDHNTKSRSQQQPQPNKMTYITTIQGMMMNREDDDE